MTENPAFFPCEPHDIWWEAGCHSPNVVFSENGFLFIREALIYHQIQNCILDLQNLDLTDDCVALLICHVT